MSDTYQDIVDQLETAINNVPINKPLLRSLWDRGVVRELYQNIRKAIRGRRRPIYIHVYRQAIDKNRKLGGNFEPPIIVRDGQHSQHCWSVDILGPSRMIYSPDKPLADGARVWIETVSEVITHQLEDEPTQTEVQE